jgi:hypothetical protein
MCVHMSSVRGCIIATYRVRCGVCGFHEYISPVLDQRRQVVSFILNLGWKYTRRDGWVCPDCIDSKMKSTTR